MFGSNPQKIEAEIDSIDQALADLTTEQARLERDKRRALLSEDGNLEEATRLSNDAGQLSQRAAMLRQRRALLAAKLPEARLEEARPAIQRAIKEQARLEREQVKALEAVHARIEELHAAVQAAGEVTERRTEHFDELVSTATSVGFQVGEIPGCEFPAANLSDAFRTQGAMQTIAREIADLGRLHNSRLATARGLLEQALGPERNAARRAEKLAATPVDERFAGGKPTERVA